MIAKTAAKSGIAMYAERDVQRDRKNSIKKTGESNTLRNVILLAVFIRLLCLNDEHVSRKMFLFIYEFPKGFYRLKRFVTGIAYVTGNGVCHGKEFCLVWFAFDKTSCVFSRKKSGSGGLNVTFRAGNLPCEKKTWHVPAFKIFGQKGGAVYKSVLVGHSVDEYFCVFKPRDGADEFFLYSPFEVALKTDEMKHLGTERVLSQAGGCAAFAFGQKPQVYKGVLAQGCCCLYRWT